MDPIYQSVINDLGDFTLEELSERVKRGGSVSEGFDSLISFARAADDCFICASDFWGIQTHYWFCDDDTFVCSDSVFIPARIAGGRLSEESVFEYLLFLSPVRDHSWFAGVKRLMPDQSLLYDPRGHTVRLTGSADAAGWLLDGDASISSLRDSVESFFMSARQRVGDRTAALSISAGSDSRTVLACLGRFGFRVRGYNFGTLSMFETKEIEQLAVRLRLDHTFIDISRHQDRWHNDFKTSVAASNGLLNPLRTHYEELYRAVPESDVIFEGILGSQFLKGELCIGATISEHHRSAIAGRGPLGAVIGSGFERLGGAFQARMREYLCDEYGGELVDVNTPAGKRSFLSYAFGVFPSRIFAGMVLVAKRRHELYQMFLSRGILRSVFRHGLGIVGSITIRDDFGGPIVSLRGEAVILKEIGSGLYDSVLDRGITFREALEYPLPVARAVKLVRNSWKKVRYRKYTFGQIDNTRIEARVAEYARSLHGTNPVLDELICGGYYKEAANIGMVLEVASEID